MELRPHYPVVTERLRLRPLTTADVGDLLAYRGDPEVCRYLPFEPMDEPVLTGRLSNGLDRRELTGEGQALTLGAELAGTGRLVGDVVLFFHSAERAEGEIGWVFHPGVAGRGYATEAAQAVLGLAFRDLGLARVTARMDGRNDSSARLAVRLGLREDVGLRRVELFKGEQSDLVTYVLSADGWRQREAAGGPRPWSGPVSCCAGPR